MKFRYIISWCLEKKSLSEKFIIEQQTTIDPDAFIFESTEYKLARSIIGITRYVTQTIRVSNTPTFVIIAYTLYTRRAQKSFG